MTFAGLMVLAVGAWAAHYYVVTRLTTATRLMTAARAGNQEAVERELRAGADPNRVWNDGGFRIHGSPHNGVTPLLFALETDSPGTYSHAPIVKALLAAGADPCAADSWQKTPLLVAVERRDVEAVRELWQHDRAGCLKALSADAMQAGYDELSNYPDDPATWALVEFLIDHVAQPGEADHPGFLVAAQNPAAQVALERLPARGVKADGESLILASIHGKADLIPWLIEHGADVNAPVANQDAEDSGPPLVRAAANPDGAGMRALVEAGADVNATDAVGRTALSRLVCETSCTTRPNPICEKQLESVRLLLQHGARRAGTDRFGRLDVVGCVQDRRIDPYRADFQALLGVPAAATAAN